jgi:hypothetical protein
MMNTKQIFWNAMLDADRINKELGDLLDIMQQHDAVIAGRLLTIMHDIQDVRAECGVRAE